MNYISTRGEQTVLEFQEAVMTGMARDGGLLLPAQIPDVRDRLRDWAHLDYKDLALEIFRLFTDLPEADARALIKKSYATFRHGEITPLVPVGDVFVLELFHGPTLAFKDVALQFLGNLFAHILERSGRRLNIVAATSGDTGSAAIHGVRGRPHINIFVMHPHKRVSPLQERQMTTVSDANVFNIALESSFDDAQRIMKTLFADLPFRDAYALGAVNSVNWARVLSQIVYYFYGAFRAQALTGAARVQFTVPTGNFGDIFAGYIAWRMGLPIRRLVLATNENDILARFFHSGKYSLGKVVPTISPSMDIQVASNFERYLYYRAGEDPARLRAWMERFGQTGALELPTLTADGEREVICAGASATVQTLATIREYWTHHHYLADPHTAVGLHVAKPFVGHGHDPMICLATAHPAKFPRAIQDATGADLAHHALLDRLMNLPTWCDVLPADTRVVREYVARHAR